MGTPRNKEPRAPPGTMGWAVQRVRRELKWTQEDLRERSGVSQSQISIIEGGKSVERIQAKSLIGLAKSLNLKPAALWDGKIERGFGAGLLGTPAHDLDKGLEAINHEKWIAYGQGLLDGQNERKEPPRDPQPAASEQRTWRERQQQP